MLPMLLLLLGLALWPALAIAEYAEQALAQLEQAERLRTNDPVRVRQLLSQLNPQFSQLDSSLKLRYLHLQAHNLAIHEQFEPALAILSHIEAEAGANDQVKALVLRADIEDNRGNRHESLLALAQASRLLSQVSDNETRFRLYDLAATVMTSNGSFKQAQDYASEAYALAQKAQNRKWQCHALYSLSVLYHATNETELLLKNAQRQVDACEGVDAIILASGLQLQGLAAASKQQPLQARKKFTEAHKQFEQAGWQIGAATTLVELAAVQLQLQQSTEAERLLAIAQPELEKSQVLEPLSRTYLLQAEIAEQHKKPATALQHYRRHMQLERQLLDDKRQRELTFNQVKFEVERNKQEEQRLQRENQLLAQQAEEENRRHQLMSGALIISAALSALLLLTLHRLHRQRGQLRYLAESDSLTGCYSRHHAMQLAEKLHASCARRRTPIAVLMVDLDHFKAINDRFGHPAGDAVLHAAGRALAQQLRQQDVIGRYGGEEFLILLPDSDRHSAEVVVNRCRLALDRLVINGPQRLPTITASIGVALSVDGKSSLNDMINCADEALYRAKDSGRDCAEYADLNDSQQPDPGTWI